MELSELKKRYSEFEKKYKLPSFKEMNEIFEIDRVDRDTDTLVREIRKVMMEKIIGYIRFLEMMINPANAPPMFLMFIKQVSDQDKQTIESAYKACVELELLALKLEIDYDEKAEAKHINEIFKVWEGVRPKMRGVMEIMERNWSGNSSGKGRGYFG